MPRSKDILTLKPIIKLPANETAAEKMKNTMKKSNQEIMKNRACMQAFQQELKRPQKKYKLKRALEN